MPSYITQTMRHTRTIKRNPELRRRIVELRKPTRIFLAGYNAGLQHAFKVEVAR
jgi:hypothetical protein